MHRIHIRIRPHIRWTDFVNSVRIGIRPDPKSLDPVWIRVGPDMKILDPMHH